MGLPIILQPNIGPALVVGGGKVATRRVGSLLAAGFTVTVVAEQIAGEIAREETVTTIRRAWQLEDIRGHALIYACTDSRDINRQIGQTARDHDIPVVVCDSQAESTFFAPAVHRQGGLTVAVSTNGRSPKLAVQLRDEIAEFLSARSGREFEDTE